MTKCFKNGVPVYCGEPFDYKTMDFEKIFEIQRNNFNQLLEIDKQAKDNGELLGRFVAEPIADGKAYYQIVKVNKNTVRIKLVEHIGDDYMIDYWGEEATINRDYAENSVIYRDKLAALFS